MWRGRRSRENNDDINFDMDDDDFDQDTGPRRFTYSELIRATNNFPEEGKLGQGGFGGVYRGYLSDLSRDIAVKKISRDLNKGRRSMCQRQVQNCPWPGICLTVSPRRMEQCVLHRDIKSSNVMLDSNFNAKLGDFGLARLVDHSLGSQTTAPVESKEEPSKVSLIEWVWQLYGEGRLLDAVDETLKEGDCDIQELECLMIIGLWCCHPEHTFRPSIRQVINALNKESPLPNLPTKFPVPTYCSLPTNVEPFYISSSSGLTGSSATGTTSSSSAHSVVSGTTPLLVDNARV
uniref:Protein kinase domain-containing protein n=1 Tax=Chenopodium quinoa TaxID=63459 RepID=A0A803NE18_CHEQI